MRNVAGGVCSVQRLSRLSEERKKSRLTQEELARLVEINRVSLARLETGEARAKPETQAKLARVLKVDPEALV
jgi:transcriptional regulator with XRE-family HTH domain